MDKLTFLLGLGQDESGHHLVLHNDKPQFCFAGDSEEEVLKKADSALRLYIRHRRATDFQTINVENGVTISHLQTVTHSLANA